MYQLDSSPGDVDAFTQNAYPITGEAENAASAVGQSDCSAASPYSDAVR